MLDQVRQLFEITPDFDLDVMSPGQDLYSLTADVLLGRQCRPLDGVPSPEE